MGTARRLYVSQIPPGTTLASRGIAVAAAERFGMLGLYIIAGIGFWILFSAGDLAIPGRRFVMVRQNALFPSHRSLCGDGFCP